MASVSTRESAQHAVERMTHRQQASATIALRNILKHGSARTVITTKSNEIDLYIPQMCSMNKGTHKIKLCWSN